MDEDLGQADDAPGGIDAIANLLSGTSHEADEQEDEQQPTSDEAEQDGESDEENDAPEGEAKPEPEQASDRKFTVTVKGEDGEEKTEEVGEQELISGYQRQADYTRKTMALADREREAFQTVTAKVEEFRGHFLQEAQSVRAVLAQAAGSRTPEELAQLAHTDPAAWAQERQRQDTLNHFISRIDQSVRQETEQSQQAARQQHQEAQKRMAQVLQGEGFDIPKLQNVFKAAHDTYGFSADQLRNINDPALIRMMRDAAEYRALKAKAPEVAKKIGAPAQQLPPARQAVPKTEKADKQLSARFRSGRAGPRDLASFIQQNRKGA